MVSIRLPYFGLLPRLKGESYNYALFEHFYVTLLPKAPWRRRKFLMPQGWGLIWAYLGLSALPELDRKVSDGAVPIALLIWLRFGFVKMGSLKVR